MKAAGLFLLTAACASGDYRPDPPAPRVARLRVEQRALIGRPGGDDFELLVEADDNINVGTARLASPDTPPCAGGLAPTHIDIEPAKRQAALRFTGAELDATGLLAGPTALDLRGEVCERMLLERWTLERPPPGFAGLAWRFTGTLAPTDGEHRLWIDYFLAERGRRVGPLRLGVELGLADTIRIDATTHDARHAMSVGMAFLAHLPTLRVPQGVLGPSLAYRVLFSWAEPELDHGAHVGLRWNLIPPRFDRRGFRGQPTAVSLGLEVTLGVVAIGAHLPRTPALGVSLVFENL